MKESTRVLIALGAGLGGGLLVAASGSSSLANAADAIAPIGALWVTGIRMTVIPLVVSLLITGVASASDLRAVGRLGGKSILTFFLLLLGCAVVVVPLVLAAFAFAPSGAAGHDLPGQAAEIASQMASASNSHPLSFGSWLTSLLPANPISAAADGAMLPLIIFTILFALAIAKAGGEVRDTLHRFFHAVSEAMLVLVRWVILLAPIGVFALVLPLAVHSGGGFAGAVGFYVLVYSLGSVVMSLLLYPVVAAAGGVPIGRFARAALPAQLIAFSSSSSVASLPALVESAERGLGLPERVTGFVLPLAVSMFKFAAPLSWTVGALFVSRFYGVPLGIGEMFTIAIASVFLASAAPGIPRGAFLMLTPLFLAVHLPVEGIGILIAVDAIPDTLATVMNVTGDLAAVAIVGRGSTAAS